MSAMHQKFAVLEDRLDDMKVSTINGRLDRLETIAVCGPKFAPSVDDVLNKMVDISQAMEPECETSPTKSAHECEPMNNESNQRQEQAMEMAETVKTQLLFDIFSESDAEDRKVTVSDASVQVSDQEGQKIQMQRESCANRNNRHYACSVEC